MRLQRFAALALGASLAMRVLACGNDYSIDAPASSTPDATPADATPIEDAGSMPTDAGAFAETPDANANADAALSCTTTCRSHFCDDDGGCHPLVFITESAYDATFDSFADASAPAYGTARGDYLCNQIYSGKTTSFVALLSTTNDNIVTRITSGNGAHRPVRGADGAIVAASYVELFATSPLQTAIDLTKTGGVIPNDEHVWTGTTTTGVLSGHACDGWTSNTAGNIGDVGLAGEVNGSWVLSDGSDHCSDLNHLYCLEVVP